MHIWINLPILLSLALLSCGSAVADDSLLFEDLSGEGDSRYEAIDDLGYELSSAGQSVPRLIALLKESDAQTRWRSARALGRLGRVASSASASLAMLLDDENPVVQVHASIALGRIGDRSEATLDALLKKIGSDDPRVARAALQTLRHLKPGPKRVGKALGALLQSGDDALMSNALDVAVSVGGDAVPALIEAIGNEKSAFYACVAISEIGPDASEAVPTLSGLLERSTDSETLRQALVALAKIGPASHSALPSIQAVATKTEDDAVRIAACYAMGSIGDPSAASSIKQLAKSGGPFQKLVCVWSYAKLHPDNSAAQDRAIELLAKALGSKREEVHNAAAVGLSELKAPPEKVAPVLLAAYQRADPDRRAIIASALANLGPKVVKKAIAALAKPEMRPLAIEVIGRLGPEASEATPRLVECLEQCDDNLEMARLQFALAAIGPGAAAAADRVAANLVSDESSVRQSALFALRRMGPSAKSATPALLDFIKTSNDAFESLAAAWAVARMDPGPVALVGISDMLTEGLTKTDTRARLETIDAVEALGPGGKMFLPLLKKLADKAVVPEVRDAAAGLLRNLEG